jgi:hypothetical protein
MNLIPITINFVMQSRTYKYYITGLSKSAGFRNATGMASFSAGLYTSTNWLSF